MLLIETLEPLDWIEDPAVSDKALNGNALNLGKITFLLFSSCLSSAFPALRESLFSVPKSKLLCSVGFLLSYKNYSVLS